jgi:cellobiose dehydrogenase (acceptor)
LRSNHWVDSNTIGSDRMKAAGDVNTTVPIIDNLFVADASIIPSVAMGNPEGTMVSMAEQVVAKI